MRSAVVYINSSSELGLLEGGAVKVKARVKLKPRIQQSEAVSAVH